MEVVLPKILAVLLDHGLIGLAALILGYLNVIQYKENKSLTERLLSEREKRIETAANAEARVQASSQELKSSNALLLSIATQLPPKRD